MLHLVNYDYDQTTDEFHATSFFNLSIDPQEKVYTKAKYYSFESQSVKEISFQTAEGKLVVQIPDLYSYAILELLP